MKVIKSIANFLLPNDFSEEMLEDFCGRHIDTYKGRLELKINLEFFFDFLALLSVGLQIRFKRIIKCFWKNETLYSGNLMTSYKSRFVILILLALCFFCLPIVFNSHIASQKPVKLMGVASAEVDLSGSTITGINLERINLRKSKLIGVNFAKSNLQRADLREADLQGADLQEVDLREANLQGADLQGADLQGADLQGADLQKANLREVVFRKANLYKANLSDSTLQEEDVTEGDLCDTKLPDNIRLDPDRDCRVQFVD